MAGISDNDSTRRSTPRLSSETASTAKISIPMPCALHATLLPVSMGVRVTRGRQPRRQRRGWRICDASWGLVLLRLIQCVPRAFRNGAHLQTFRTVVDKVCRDHPPLEFSVCFDELPVCVRWRVLCRHRVGVCGHVCAKTPTGAWRQK